MMKTSQLMREWKGASLKDTTIFQKTSRRCWQVCTEWNSQGEFANFKSADATCTPLPTLQSQQSWRKGDINQPCVCQARGTEKSWRGRQLRHGWRRIRRISYANASEFVFPCTPRSFSNREMTSTVSMVTVLYFFIPLVASYKPFIIADVCLCARW